MIRYFDSPLLWLMSRLDRLLLAGRSSVQHPQVTSLYALPIGFARICPLFNRVSCTDKNGHDDITT